MYICYDCGEEFRMWDTDGKTGVCVCPFCGSFDFYSKTENEDYDDVYDCCD